MGQVVSEDPVRRALAKGHAQAQREVCAGIREGEIVTFDKAYVDFDHLAHLGERGVNRVTRAKENLSARVLESSPVPAGGKIVSDELIGLESPRSRAACPEVLRRVVAWVQVDGEERLMTFLTRFKIVAADFAPKVALEQLIKDQGRDKRRQDSAPMIETAPSLPWRRPT